MLENRLEREPAQTYRRLDRERHVVERKGLAVVDRNPEKVTQWLGRHSAKDMDLAFERP